LLLLLAAAVPGLIHELVLDRADQATAPLRSGMLFFGCAVVTQQLAAGGGSSSSRPAAPADASAAKIAAAALGRLAQQPWVAASNDLTSAAAVFAAAAAGLLPPVLRYQRADAGVFIEFQPPAQEQLQEQAQHAAAGAAGSGSLAGIVLAPALWFRFNDAGAAAQPGEQDAAAAAQGAAGAGAGDVQGLLQHPFFGDADEDAASVGDDAGGSSSDGAAGSEDPAAGLAAGAGEAGAGPAVAHMPEPELLPPAQVCEAEPQMPAAAVEVGTALGWHPTSQRTGMLALRLARPRLASLVCAKLLDSEDRNAAFNAARGGCNIDCALVLCRGQDLWEVPDGLTVLGPSG
jgi:hypothetical protein